MRLAPLFLLLAFVLILSACVPKVPVPATGVLAPASGSAAEDASTSLVRTDQQGAVVVEVTPLNLDTPGQTLDFQVALNTHSVNLNMDFARLASLSTDNGNSVQAIAWEGPQGGHHLTGTMQFPATENGKSLLDGAARVTLTLKGVDAPERVFSWDLGK